MQNLLFYSEYCKFSKLLIKKLEDENLINEFKLIDIKTVKELPKIITNVPTIIVKNINRPLVGIHAFNWIENTKYFYQKTNNIKNVFKIPPSKNDINQLKGFKSVNKISDDFSSINDKDDNILTYEKFVSPTNSGINFKITDNQELITETKINQTVQQKKLHELILLRNKQIETIINKTNQ